MDVYFITKKESEIMYKESKITYTAHTFTILDCFIG